MGACDGEWAKRWTAKGVLASFDCVQRKREERECGVMGVNVACPAPWAFYGFCKLGFQDLVNLESFLLREKEKGNGKRGRE